MSKENTGTIVIYTDGSCLPGRNGGWSALTEYPDGRREVMSGNAEETTNNKMELTGVIKALEQIPDNSIVNVISDSEYTVEGVNHRLDKWKKNNWTRVKTTKKIKNKGLWLEIDKHRQRLDVRLSWVKAHDITTPIQNQLADILARDEASKLI